MKTITFFLALILCASAFGQSPSTEILGGVIIRNGGNTKWGVQFSKGLLDLISGTNEAGVVNKKLSLKVGGIYADDIYFTDDELKELEAVSLMAVIERSYNKFTFSAGAGAMDINQNGGNDWKVPILVKCDYALFDKFTIGAHATLIPSIGQPDMIFTGLSIGFK